MRCSIVLALVMVVGCGSSSSTPPVPDAGPADTVVLMDFARTTSFWSAPFPSEDLRNADGSIAIAGFPNSSQRVLVNDAKDLIARSARGFALAGGVFFQLSAPIDPTQLPDLAGSLTPGAKAYLVDVDPTSPRVGQRAPIETFFTADDYPFGPPNLVSLLPLQGVPLRIHTTYAAVILRSLNDANGHPLGRSAEMTALAKHQRPASLPAAAFATYDAALTTLVAGGLAADDIAALAVFTTDDPTAGLVAFHDALLARPHPVIDAPLTASGEIFDDYCVYHTTIAMPDFQGGTPPFDTDGGEWVVDDSGAPVVQRNEEANVWVTIPRRAAPVGGFPTVVFVRTGGGGDRPLVDRGKQAMNGGPPIVPGSGYAREFAQAGWAGISVDGPLGGLRNTTGGDEQFLVFNVTNARALRDNIRESALELTLVSHLLDDLSVDASGCPGVAAAGVRFDTARVAIMGHSTGAWITPLAVAVEPRFQAAVLSGAGGSWIENVLYKLKPLEVRPAIEALLSATIHGGGDTVLTLIEWAAEPADPQAYVGRVVRGTPARHVLMEQGIVDHYILPRIANATSLGLGVDLAGTPLDSDVGVADQVSVVGLLPYSGGVQVSFPVMGNLNDGATTAIVAQHPSDDIEDGHEMVFQTDPPRQEIRCFFDSLAVGVPRVPLYTTLGAPCQ